MTELRARLTDIGHQLAMFPQEVALRVSRLESQIADIEQREAELEGRRAYVVKAPVAGTIASIRGIPGAIISPHQPLASILPAGSQLEAELFVPSRAAGFVAEGQPVRLLYAAFPYQRFGTHEGVIRHVAPAITSATEADVPFNLVEPSYRVAVRLKSQPFIFRLVDGTVPGSELLMAAADLKHLNFGARKLPIIRQNETTECGLACLAMVAGFHGFQTDIAALRRRLPTSVAGVTLSALMDMAARMNLSCRALKVPLEDVRKLQTPAIIHWDMNHFVVLKSARAKTMVVHDPATGARRYTRDAFSAHFTGVALELHPTKEFERKEESARLRLNHLWMRIRGLKRTLAQALVLSAILQLFVLVSPFYLQLTVDEVLVKFDADLLWALAFGFGAFAVLNAVAGLLRGYVLLYFGNMLNYQMAISSPT